jgi:hypothetical protein
MSERKMRVLGIVPALCAMLASSFLVMPVDSDVRAALMGVCIGFSFVALVALTRARRAARRED